MNPNIKKFEARVLDTIKSFKLITKNDKVMVAASGGKDSTSVLYILSKHYNNIEALHIDVFINNYSEKNKEYLKKFCKENKVKLHIVDFKKEFKHDLVSIHKRLRKKGIKARPCAICGVLRRYLMNKYAKKLKATKLVTGHNLNDEAETIMMNMSKANLSLLARQGPMTGIKSHKSLVQRIKPLYFNTEKEVIEYSKAKKFELCYCKCPLSED